MAVAGELKFVITTDSTGAVKSINAVDESEKKLEASTNKTSNALLKQVKQFIGVTSAVVAAKKVYDFISDSISVASEAIEQHTKLQTVFKNEIEKTNSIVDDLTSNYGLSTLQAERMLGATGDLLTGLGMMESTALALSEQTQKMAVDLASFTNIQGGAQRASEAITKAMLGERESIKALGISILESDVQQRLMEKGQLALSGTALKAAKAQATLEIAMQQSKNAMGDFSRTQDSFANQSRMLESNIEDLKVEIGKTFVQMLLPFLRDFSAWVKENKESIIAFFEALGKAIKGVADAFSFASTFGRKFMETISDLGQEQNNYSNELKRTAEEEAKITADFMDMIDEHERLIGKKKELTKETNILNNETAKSTGPLTEAERIMKQYNVSLASANVILKTRRPDMEKIEKLQKELNISQEEAAKLLKILNAEEKVYNEELKKKKAGLLEIPEAQEIINRNIREEIDLIPGLDKFAETTGEIEKELKKEAEAMEKAKEEAEKLTKELEKQRKVTGLIIQGLQELSGLSFVPDKLAKGFSAMGTAIQQIVSGDWLGLIGTGVNFITDTFTKSDGLHNAIGLATDLLRELGITGEEMANELAKILDDLAKKMTMKDALEGAKDGLKEFQDEAKKAAEELAKTTSQWWEPMRDLMPALEDFLAVPAKNAKEFDAQMNITLSTFVGLLKSGMSMTEALTKMDGAFEKLIASQDALGLKGNKAFEELKKFRQLIKDNESLVKSVEGLNSVLTVTASRAKLSQEDFDSYANTLQSKFKDLEKAGFNQSQIFELMAPSLKALADQAEKYGLKLDANTQRMIDQAKAGGHFDALADPMDRVVDVLEKIFQQLGGNIEELSNYGTTAADAAAKTEQGFDKATASIYKVGDATATATQEMSENFKKGTSFAQEHIDLLVKSSVDKLSKLGDVPLNFGTPSVPGVPGVPKIPKVGFQTGTPPGGFTVPPGFPNDSFNVGLTSGERVTVSKPGEQYGGDMFDVTIYSQPKIDRNMSQGDYNAMLLNAIERDGKVRDAIKKRVGT